MPVRVSRGGAELPLSLKGSLRGEGLELEASPGLGVPGSLRSEWQQLCLLHLRLSPARRKAAVCVSPSERPGVNPESRVGAQRRRRGARAGAPCAQRSPEGAPRCLIAPTPIYRPQRPRDSVMVAVAIVLVWGFSGVAGNRPCLRRLRGPFVPAKLHGIWHHLPSRTTPHPQPRTGVAQR